MDFTPLLENAPLSIVVVPEGTLTVVILEQPENAPLAITFNAELRATLLFPFGQIKSFVQDAL